jgi:hypothetical protein
MQKVVNAVTAWLMLAFILIVWNSASRAEVLLLEDAIEVRTNTIYWSGLRAGRLVVRSCPDCSPRSLRVDDATRYLIRGVGEFLQPGPFLDEVDDAAVRNGVGAIFLVRGTDQISRILLLPAEGN